jgi:NAD(P)-dependent dehydrogenase (short-subunit alcohol dehydrogenase family)
VQDFVGRTWGQFGAIHALSKNAGIVGILKPVSEYPLEVFQKVLAANVVGVFLCMKHTIPIMVEQGGGSIINNSSIAGLIGTPGIIGYSASKHAVMGLTRTAAVEWGRKGIRVNSVNPGPIESRMMGFLEESGMPGKADEARESIVKGVPAGRYGTPDEVAAVVAFLASDDSTYVNGATYSVDGGQAAS